MRRAALANGMYSASIYYRRVEDISMEFIPEHNANNAQEAATFNIGGCMGPPLGVWNIEDWQRLDNDAPAT
eukprot:6333704-Amphidinium_carterae.1